MAPEIVELLRKMLLVTIRDRGDRLRVEYMDEWSYQVFVFVDGVRWEMVPPSSEEVQQFPAVLALWESPFERAWHRATSLARRWASGTQRGRFRFPVGAGAVSVAYRVRWRSRRVEEIDLAIRGADSVENGRSGAERQSLHPEGVTQRSPGSRAQRAHPGNAGNAEGVVQPCVAASCHPDESPAPGCARDPGLRRRTPSG